MPVTFLEKGGPLPPVEDREGEEGVTNGVGAGVFPRRRRWKERPTVTAKIQERWKLIFATRGSERGG